MFYEFLRPLNAYMFLKTGLKKGKNAKKRKLYKMGKRIFMGTRTKGDDKGVIYNRKILKSFFPRFHPYFLYSFSAFPCKLSAELNLISKNVT